MLRFTRRPHRSPVWAACAAVMLLTLLGGCRSDQPSRDDRVARNASSEAQGRDHDAAHAPKARRRSH